MTPLRACRGSERGATVLELVVAMGIFALVAALAGAVIAAASRVERSTVLGADVQQSARLAMERLARELRESAAGEVLTGGRPGAMWVLFKSARLAADPSVFCLHVSAAAAWPEASSPDCFTFPGGDIPAPLHGTYVPIWQRYVGYYAAAAAEGPVLRRVAGQLAAPEMRLDPSLLVGGETVAEHVQVFDVTLSGRRFTAALRTRGSVVVQGAPVEQEARLLGVGFVRN